LIFELEYLMDGDGWMSEGWYVDLDKAMIEAVVISVLLDVPARVVHGATRETVYYVPVDSPRRTLPPPEPLRWQEVGF
jgi:hypothetical protein